MVESSLLRLTLPVANPGILSCLGSTLQGHVADRSQRQSIVAVTMKTDLCGLPLLAVHLQAASAGKVVNNVSQSENGTRNGELCCPPCDTLFPGIQRSFKEFFF